MRNKTDTTEMEMILKTSMYGWLIGFDEPWLPKNATGGLWYLGRPPWKGKKEKKEGRKLGDPRVLMFKTG